MEITQALLSSPLEAATFPGPERHVAFPDLSILDRCSCGISNAVVLLSTAGASSGDTHDLAMTKGYQIYAQNLIVP
jgi:hypothetical protein